MLSQPFANGSKTLLKLGSEFCRIPGKFLGNWVISREFTYYKYMLSQPFVNGYVNPLQDLAQKFQDTRIVVGDLHSIYMIAQPFWEGYS